jgi:hypothetical protein
MLPADINPVYICTVMTRHCRPLPSPFDQPVASCALGFLVCQDGRDQPQQKAIRTGVGEPGKGLACIPYELCVNSGASWRVELSDCERYWLATITTPAGYKKFRVFSDLGKAIDAGLAWARHQRAS